jgi:putative glutamine amidotransferase
VAPGKPVIGVSTSFHDFGDYLGVGYHKPIALAGGVPVILPRLAESTDDLLDLCDGLLLSSGRDIEPWRYGQSPHPRLGPVDPARDEFELALVRVAHQRRLPLLGVCRGMQVINVALGGTLFQDLELVPGAESHPRDPQWNAWRTVERAALAGEELPPHPRHAVELDGDSLLARALGSARLDVDSFHHQACDLIAPALYVSGRAPDGVVEMIEGRDGRFVLGAQCELHEEWRVDERVLRVFEAFVAAARDG